MSSEMYLRLFQTSIMEFFCENRYVEIMTLKRIVLKAHVFLYVLQNNPKNHNMFYDELKRARLNISIHSEIMTIPNLLTYATWCLNVPQQK